MKFEVKTKQFALATRVVSIIATREAFPNESAHVFIHAEEAKIIFAATDRESQVELMVQDVSVSETGEITFYVPTLKALCSRLVGESVFVHHIQDSSTVSFSSGYFKGSMNLISCRDLKNISIPSVENSAEFQSDDFSAALGQVCFAAASERSASQRSLSDIKIIGKKDCLEFVGCDGYRLAIKKLLCSLENPASFDVSLPARSLNKVRTVLGEIPEQRILVGASRNELVIKGEGWGITCTLSALVYPPLYKEMIPSRTKTTATLDRETLLGALRRSSCLGLLDETFPRTITISFQKNRLKLDAHNEVGRGSEDVKAKVGGPSLKISISANHMEDGL